MPDLKELVKIVNFELTYFKKLVETKRPLGIAFKNLKTAFKQLEKKVPAEPDSDLKVKKIEALERQINGRQNLLNYHKFNKPAIYKKHLKEIELLKLKLTELKK